MALCRVFYVDGFQSMAAFVAETLETEVFNLPIELHNFESQSCAKYRCASLSQSKYVATGLEDITILIMTPAFMEIFRSAKDSSILEPLGLGNATMIAIFCEEINDTDLLNLLLPEPWYSLTLMSFRQCISDLLSLLEKLDLIVFKADKSQMSSKGHQKLSFTNSRSFSRENKQNNLSQNTSKEYTQDQPPPLPKTSPPFINIIPPHKATDSFRNILPKNLKLSLPMVLESKRNHNEDMNDSSDDSKHSQNENDESIYEEIDNILIAGVNESAIEEQKYNVLRKRSLRGRRSLRRAVKIKNENMINNLLPGAMAEQVVPNLTSDMVSPYDISPLIADISSSTSSSSCSSNDDIPDSARLDLLKLFRLTAKHNLQGLDKDLALESWEDRVRKAILREGAEGKRRTKVNNDESNTVTIGQLKSQYCLPSLRCKDDADDEGEDTYLPCMYRRALLHNSSESPSVSTSQESETKLDIHEQSENSLSDYVPMSYPSTSAERPDSTHSLSMSDKRTDSTSSLSTLAKRTNSTSSLSTLTKRPDSTHSLSMSDKKTESRNSLSTLAKRPDCASSMTSSTKKTDTTKSMILNEDELKDFLSKLFAKCSNSSGDCSADKTEGFLLPNSSSKQDLSSGSPSERLSYKDFYDGFTHTKGARFRRSSVSTAQDYQPRPILKHNFSLINIDQCFTEENVESNVTNGLTVVNQQKDCHGDLSQQPPNLTLPPLGSFDCFRPKDVTLDSSPPLPSRSPIVPVTAVLRETVLSKMMSGSYTNLSFQPKGNNASLTDDSRKASAADMKFVQTQESIEERLNINSSTETSSGDEETEVELRLSPKGKQDIRECYMIEENSIMGSSSEPQINKNVLPSIIFNETDGTSEATSMQKSPREQSKSLGLFRKISKKFSQKSLPRASRDYTTKM